MSHVVLCRRGHLRRFRLTPADRSVCPARCPVSGRMRDGAVSLGDSRVAITGFSCEFQLIVHAGDIECVKQIISTFSGPRLRSNWRSASRTASASSSASCCSAGSTTAIACTSSPPRPRESFPLRSTRSVTTRFDPCSRSGRARLFGFARQVPSTDAPQWTVSRRRACQQVRVVVITNRRAASLGEGDLGRG